MTGFLKEVGGCISTVLLFLFWTVAFILVVITLTVLDKVMDWIG